ncbi:TetR/AcrR family transcriptional regulator [Neisseriaceae bacterium TC5R-5]|nr:TetR/AcrR family transcriptional regulator [Neisseriaceae bacterium TC5R-5]
MSQIKVFTDTREHLLATGEAIILGKGFAATGLAEILGSAGVPKGSFYHYFSSKEGFGVALLQRYFEQYNLSLISRLHEEQGSARSCLLAYFEGWLHSHCCDHPNQSCLAVKLAAEVSDLSEPMREALSTGMAYIIHNLASCIRRGQTEGSLHPALLAEQTASALYSLWLGSLLIFKVQRSLLPLESAMAQTKQILQQP